jgi:regulator of replication initiation timing
MDSRGEESRRLYTDSQNLRREGQALCSHVQSLLAESTQLRLSAATLKRQIQHVLEKLCPKILPYRPN